jgi:uncharacterized membrane protein YfcA
MFGQSRPRTSLQLINPLYSISGFVVGVLVGMTGVGGGSLMTPLLVLLFGIHPATAVGTDLLYAATTKTVGTMIHGFAGTVAWPVVLRLGSGSLPAVALTILWLSRFGRPGPHQSHMISFVLGIALLLTAVCMIFRSQIVTYVERRFGEPSPRTASILTVCTGVILGVFVTISSVGAGAIGVTVLLLLYPRMKLSHIIGSDIAHAVPLAFAAGAGHWLIGSVDWHLFFSLITGSIPGIIVGSVIATRVSDRVLRPTLAIVLVLVGAKLVF